ncbi:ammonia-forming cytochrome c nitrite reductase subunit c552 [Chrysiogenes arsenatis]|uniref:ammonia-forming cytochrome c nitrite reductase subunit c552 n=1 Tax=Chrysiogenes arsenatis TaxID=309797 RepID=UPI000423FEB1|nr:ammonia-forming cytochrome c nitrite reductase subunit c552 [Chrysiogenes arsenatis]
MKKIFSTLLATLFVAGSVAASSTIDLGEGNLKYKDMPQYQSYLKNKDNTQMTEYGGSVPYDKHDGVNPLPKGYKHAQPYLKNLWLGYPFSYEYKRAQGHTQAIEDVTHIDRINRYSEQAGLPATCWNCKTTTIPTLVEKFGDKFWSSNFHDYREAHEGSKHAIGCANCHDEKTFALAITSFPLDEALKRQGKDWRKASKQEMRSLVCAQCHVEYYFETKDHGVAAKPHLPWDKGMNPADMYEFYSNGDPKRDAFKGAFTDFTHAASKTKIIKAQHPEYEMFSDGVHGAAGVSCSDCHMPRDKNGMSSHHWTSPLKSTESIQASCVSCHKDKTPEYLKGRVEFHQEKAWKQLNIAQEKSVRAHEAVRLAMEFKGVDEKLLAEAREMTRKGQWFWDYVSAENSAGFHNPTKTLDTLASSQQYSDQAVQLAMQATGYAIAPKLEGPIEKIVPPIMEHSRKLQQDQKHLDSHVWLKYLPVLPQADLVWDKNKKLK